ncbi:hypothetical protein [Staphylococcus parequorum]|uniref:hypothetical protein n=1 Tax=unclassified Staphylococcus TaxID=91994 RepID=UPI003CFFEA05
MVNKPKIFEEFFYNVDNETVDIEELNTYIEKNNRNINKYRGKMFCPECKVAKLTYVSKTTTRRAHLKKIPSANHYENCTYNYEYANQKLLIKYIESLNYNQVQDKLNAIMNMLFNNKDNENIENNAYIKKNNKFFNPNLISDITKKQRDLKAIRRKKLQGWIDKSYEADLYLFYGEAKLSVEEKISKNNKNYKFYILTIFTKDKVGEWKFRATVYRHNIKDKVNEDSIYQIALIGRLNLDFKYPGINLLNKNAIKYELI